MQKQFETSEEQPITTRDEEEKDDTCRILSSTSANNTELAEKNRVIMSEPLQSNESEIEKEIEPSPHIVSKGEGNDHEQSSEPVPLEPISSTSISSELNGGCDTFVEPGSNDVLFGRGRPLQRRPANVRFRQLVDSHQVVYDGAKRREKPKIASMIVQRVRESSGRFLKQGKAAGTWVEVDDDEARIKVCHDFRNRRLLSKKSELKARMLVSSSISSD